MQKTTTVVLALGAILLGAGCSSAPAAQVNAVPTVSQGQTATTTVSTDKTYTLDDVAKHAAQADCWTVVGGKVYDVTKAIDGHPGGVDKIMLGCGKDGTAIFNGIKDGAGHPQRAGENLRQFLVGALKQ